GRAYAVLEPAQPLERAGARARARRLAQRDAAPALGPAATFVVTYACALAVRVAAHRAVDAAVAAVAELPARLRTLATVAVDRHAATALGAATALLGAGLGAVGIGGAFAQLPPGKGQRGDTRRAVGAVSRARRRQLVVAEIGRAHV